MITRPGAAPTSPAALLETTLAVFADVGATRDDETISIPIGDAIALELDLIEEPMIPTHFALMFRAWDRTHGLSDERWLCSWPPDSVTDGRLRTYVMGLVDTYNGEEGARSLTQHVAQRQANWGFTNPR